MFRIGDFSKLSRVPVKTLRYYDEIGLLKPTGIDRFTRYRYYALEQLPQLYRILGLKELGFSLDQIGQLLEGQLEKGQLHRMLEKKRTEIKSQMEQQSEQLKRLEARLAQIEQEGRMPDYEIVVKKVDPQWVASVRGLITNYEQSEPIFDRLFDEVYGYVHKQGVRNPGCGLAIYHEDQAQGENIPVEAAAQLAAPIKGSSRVRVYQLPSYDSVACVVHHGPFATLNEAYQSLAAWTQSNLFRVIGPTREIYLRYQRGVDQSQFITEIQFPVKKLTGGEKMETRIIHLDKFLVVGMKYSGKNENGEIGKMWGEFIPRIHDIQHTTESEVSYGVCLDAVGGGMDYIAGVPVTELSDIPTDMVGMEIPAQDYVVFPSEGLDQIGPTYQRILKEWLPKSDYEAAGTPDFEYYPSEFDPDDPDSILYIYFPIRKNAS
jgi:predicted transcriptional regulator YdeE/DNA-binding transcriptional MerR regulator